MYVFAHLSGLFDLHLMSLCSNCMRLSSHFIYIYHIWKEEFTTLVESVGGRLEVAGTCFWDNALTLAPISVDNANYTSRNNFGTNNSRPYVVENVFV